MKNHSFAGFKGLCLSPKKRFTLSSCHHGVICLHIAPFTLHQNLFSRFSPTSTIPTFEQFGFPVKRSCHLFPSTKFELLSTTASRGSKKILSAKPDTEIEIFSQRRCGTIFCRFHYEKQLFLEHSDFFKKEFLEPDVLGMEDQNKRLTLSTDEPETKRFM